MAFQATRLTFNLSLHSDLRLLLHNAHVINIKGRSLPAQRLGKRPRCPRAVKHGPPAGA